MNAITFHSQGRRHNFKSGGYKYYCKGREQKFLGGCTPTYAILGGNSYKERHTANFKIGKRGVLSDVQRCYNILLVVLVH